MNTLKFLQTKYKPCIICGNPFTDKHHVIPLKYFGDDTEENKIDLCANHHRLLHFLMYNDNLFDENRKNLNLIQKEKKLLIEKYITLNEKKTYDFYKNYIKPLLLKYKSIYYKKLLLRKEELLNIQQELLQTEKINKWAELFIKFNEITKYKLKPIQTNEEYLVAKQVLNNLEQIIFDAKKVVELIN